MRIVLGLVAMTAVGGCRDKTPRPDPTPAPTAITSDGSMPAVLPSTVRVALLDSGAEPRQPRRYALSVGDHQLVVLRVRYGATNRVRAAKATQLKFPALKLVFQVEIVEALRGDQVRYRFDLAEAALTDTSGVDKRLLRVAGETLKKAQGLRGSAVVDALGVIRDGTIDIPGQLDPSMQIMIDSIRSSMEQLSVPLPEEPIGIGARWEVSQTLVQGGTTLFQTTVFELKSDTDSLIELTGTIEQEADRQEVSVPGLEYSELESLTGRGTATIAFGLGRLAPQRATMALESESRFEFAVKGGRRKTLMSKGTMEIGVAGK